MKIVFVSDAVYPFHKGGKEKRLYELSKRIAKLGHRVHIYTMHWWDSQETAVTLEGVTYHAICKLHPLYKGDRRSIKQGLLFGLACFKLFRVKFDAIDVDHMPYFPIFSSWIVCRLRGRRMFGTWHEALSRRDWTDYMGKLGYLSYLIERLSIRLPDYITASSPHTVGLLNAYHGRADGVFLVPPGIDGRHLAALKPADINCDVLYTGRLVKDKNVVKLIDAISVIVARGKNVKCIIIGHGPEENNIRAKIQHLGLQEYIRLLEPLPKSDDVYSYMKASKVFVLPSVREGFGMVAIEALGCNTPVITIDAVSNAAKDLIIAGKNGAVVKLDSGAIADSIEFWVQKDKQDIAKYINSEYDWDSLARKQIEVYQS